MVDRITPAATDDTRERAARLTGFIDEAAVETEPFSQWVIEDRFPHRRPAWQAWGAMFVEDVAPYERMKLRMLNGAHSMIAYTGSLTGHSFVRDVMRSSKLTHLVHRHLVAAARTLSPLPGISFDDYARDLAGRFANPAIAHKTYQIAMDGTEKLPQRILAPALDALQQGSDVRPFAFAFAAWARYCLGISESGEHYDLRDPRQEQISEIVRAADGDAGRIVHGRLSLPSIFPQEIACAEQFVESSREVLAAILVDGMRATIDAEAAR